MGVGGGGTTKKKQSLFRILKISKTVKWGSFSDNTAKRVVFTETKNTLFRVFLSILCSSIGTPFLVENLRGQVFSRWHSLILFNFSVLTQEDHGDYTCHLRNIAYNKIIKEETLRMYGKGTGFKIMSQNAVF